MSTEFLTTTEAAAILGVTGSEVRRLLDSGKLGGVKRGRGRGGAWELSPESVERRRKEMEGKKYTVYLFGEKHETNSLKKAREIAQAALNYCQPPENQIIERATGNSIPIMDDSEDEDE